MPVTLDTESVTTPVVLPAISAPSTSSTATESPWHSALIPLLMGGSALGLAFWALARTW
jgi:hypothetical protein